MIDEALHRKAQFAAALTYAGLTRRQFAASRNVTPEHLGYVLAGTRESARLVAEVDAFIAEHAPRTVAA